MKASIIIVNIVSLVKDSAFSLFGVIRLPSLQLQIASSDPLPDIVDLIDDSLEVGSSIVRTGDENAVGLARGCRSVQWVDRNELVRDRSKELKAGLDLSRRIFGLNDCADDRDVHVFGANVVGGRNHGNVYIVSPSDLVLGDNDLTTVRVVRSRDGVFEETNCSNDFALLKDPYLSTLGFLAGTEVGRIADDHLGLDSFLPRTDTDEHAIIVSDNFIDRLVEHVGTAVDGRETGE